MGIHLPVFFVSCDKCADWIEVRWSAEAKTLRKALALARDKLVQHGWREKNDSRWNCPGCLQGQASWEHKHEQTIEPRLEGRMMTLAEIDEAL